MRGKNKLVIHQTLSLVATSHLVSGYLLHLWQGSEKNASEELEQYWQTGETKLFQSFQDLMGATHLL